MASEGELLDAIGQVQASIDGVRDDLTRRTNVNRNTVVVAVLLAIVGLGVGAYGIRAQQDTTSSTRRARVASCEQFNVQQHRQAAAEVKQSHDFVTQLTKGSKNPRVAAAVKAYNVEHDALILASHTLRDCTPTGIRRYLSTTGTKA